jgi:hypothetical protein
VTGAGTDVAPGSGRPLASHLIAWGAVGGVVGWFIAYEILRFSGHSPHDAALPAVWTGAILGILIAVGAVFVARRAEAHGRTVGFHRMRRADITRMTPTDREIVRWAWPILLGAAAIIAIVAVIIGIHWLTIHGARPKSSLLMIVWDLVVAAWIVDEARRLRDYVFEGIDALLFGCMLTMVMAAIGISRNVIVGGQVVVIVAAAVAGATLGIVSWRVSGGRYVPIASSLIVIVAAVCLVAPLAW